jgi:hypothetical protein
MSTLPPKPDIGIQARNVRFVPKADIQHAAFFGPRLNLSLGSVAALGEVKNPKAPAVVLGRGNLEKYPGNCEQAAIASKGVGRRSSRNVLNFSTRRVSDSKALGQIVIAAP